jgi:hypothetical protein
MLISGQVVVYPPFSSSENGKLLSCLYSSYTALNYYKISTILPIIGQTTTAKLCPISLEETAYYYKKEIVA